MCCPVECFWTCASDSRRGPCSGPAGPQKHTHPTCEFADLPEDLFLGGFNANLSYDIKLIHFRSGIVHCRIVLLPATCKDAQRTYLPRYLPTVEYAGQTMGGDLEITHACTAHLRNGLDVASWVFAVYLQARLKSHNPPPSCNDTLPNGVKQDCRGRPRSCGVMCAAQCPEGVFLSTYIIQARRQCTIQTSS
jgi:hypothetical protein